MDKLTILLRLISDLGGSIELRSGPSVGSAVTATLRLHGTLNAPGKAVFAGFGETAEDAITRLHVAILEGKITMDEEVKA